MNILSNLSRISVFEFRPFITVSFILVLIFSFSLTGNLYAQMPSVVCSADANGIPYQICQYSNLQLHAVEENGQQGTFHWVGPNNFQSSVQNPILTNISTLSTGNYSVTFTNNQNQTSSCTIEIIVRNCCLSANTPSNFLTGPISQIGAIDYSLPIICDNLLIDNNFSFPPLTNLVFTDQNTQKSIIVQPGSELKLSNSHVTQCFSAYHGIVIEPEGLVNIEDCYFEYATTMIVAKGGSGLTVKNSRFHANHIAIDVPPPFDPTIYQSVNPFYLTGNIFECTSDIVPCSGQLSYCGVRLHNLHADIDGPDENTFSNMLNGIILIDGNYTIGNTVFNDISNYPGYPISGNGIYASGEHNELITQRLNQIGLGIAGPPTFSNCNTGINVRNMDIRIENNKMLNVNSGIYGQSFFGKIVTIYKNYIGCHDQGIFIRNYSPSNSIEISYNNVSISNPTQDNFETAGIKLYEGLQDNFRPSVLFFNKVFTQNAYNSIIVNQCFKPEIHENQAMLLDYQTNINGLNIIGCQKANVSCNYLIGIGASLGYSSSYNPKGITVTSTTSSHINCNYLRDVYCGLNIEEICLDTEIKGNIFEDHSVGLRYNKWANTGPQEAKGNQWLNPTMPLGAIHEGANPPFDYFSADENNSILTPTNKYPNTGWFINSFATVKSCNNECWFWDTNSAIDSINSIDSLIAIHGIPSTEYEDEINWAAGRYLFEKILQNSDQYSGNLFQQYFDSIAMESGGLFEQIKQTKNAAWKTDSISITSMLALYDATESLLDSIYKLDSLLSTELCLQDSLLAGILLQSALVSYNSLNTQIYVLLNLIRGQANNTIDSLRIMNMSMSDSLVYEENEKWVNEILLSILSNGKDTLTPNEITILEGIAAQCPVSGGLSVYMARSLLSGIFDTHYNDQLLCIQNGIIKNSEVLTSINNNVTFTLKPIPSKGSVILNWSLPTNLESKYFLFDISGRLILSREFNLNDNLISIDLKEKADGVYFLHIKPEGKPVSIHKIILVK